MPQATGKKTPPMPLGDTWSGICRAAQNDGWQPDAHTAQQLCNFGYAREKCARVPAGGADAVRFSISDDRDGLIRIYWVVEKDHLPSAHGRLEYSCTDHGFKIAHADACIAQQAQAYIGGYLRRKTRSANS